MMYNKIVQECFFSPSHVGVLDLMAPLSVHYSCNKMGVLIDLYSQCTAKKEIMKACFKTNGNPFVIAGLEWICRQIEGENLDALPILNYQVLVEQLDIPNSQYPVALHIETVYKEVLLLMKKKFER